MHVERDSDHTVESPRLIFSLRLSDTLSSPAIFHASQAASGAPITECVGHAAFSTGREEILSCRIVVHSRQFDVTIDIEENGRSSLSTNDRIEIHSPFDERVNPRRNAWTDHHMALTWGDVKELTDLLNLKDVGARDKDGNTALHLAAKVGIDELVGWLLEAGSDVNAQNGFGCTPLHFAGEGENGGVIERLLHSGADINSRDHDDSTPLNNAAFSGNREVVAKLLAGKPDIDARDSSGHSALHSAAIRGKDERSEGVLEALLEAFLNAGAGVNAPTKYSFFREHEGYMAVHPAVFSGCLKTVYVLVMRGADLSATTPSGKDVLAIAREERQRLEILRSRGQNVDESLQEMKNIEMFLSVVKRSSRIQRGVDEKAMGISINIGIQ
jgi:Ankyrin repeats (3 copies)